jgi:hypothetical protein
MKRERIGGIIPSPKAAVESMLQGVSLAWNPKLTIILEAFR